MKEALKKRLTYADLLLMLVNLVPLYGVWFQGWNAEEVFLVYLLESVIIGLYNILKMSLTSLVKKQDDWYNKGSTTKQYGLFFIIFFLLHFGFFVIIQMNIFFGITKFDKLPGGPTGVGDFLLHFPRYLSEPVTWLLVSFVISYGFMVFKDFILTRRYRNASFGLLMIEPYPRIFVQQFAVILGAFFLMMGAGKIFILIFVLCKIFFEIAIDYEKLIRQNMQVESV